MQSTRREWHPDRLLATIDCFLSAMDDRYKAWEAAPPADASDKAPGALGDAQMSADFTRLVQVLAVRYVI